MTVRKCGKTTEVEDDDVDIEGIWSKAGSKWAAARRLSLEIQREYTEHNEKTGKEEQRRKSREEEFIVVRKSTTADWRILVTTLDEPYYW